MSQLKFYPKLLLHSVISIQGPLLAGRDHAVQMCQALGQKKLFFLVPCLLHLKTKIATGRSIRRNMENTQTNLGSNRWNMRKRMEKWVGNTTLGGFLSQFSIRFIHTQINQRMTAEYALWWNQYITLHSCDVFLRHMVSYGKFIWMTLVASSDQLFLSYHFMEDQLLTLRRNIKCLNVIRNVIKLHKIRNVIKCLKIWFICLINSHVAV